MAACSPQTLTMNVEMRYPSKSGIDLSRKSIAVVYMDDGTPVDTLFSSAVASGLAASLEEDYFGGAQVISIYKVPADSVTLDLMHGLVMDSGDDVIFLLEAPSFGEVAFGENMVVQHARSVDSAFVAPAQIPFSSRVHVYDSMDTSDQVKRFGGSSVLRTRVYNNGITATSFLAEKALSSLGTAAHNVGTQTSNPFLSTWRTERYSLYYYDNLDDRWTEAAEYAFSYQWHKAIDLWLKLLSPKNGEKRACASYNLALAFYMLGDLPLAEKWLDQADDAFSLSLSPGLRKRIEARK